MGKAGKTWVLETQTKGTGANMVPLERILRKPGEGAVEGFVFSKPKQPEPSREEPRQPLSFRVVDVMTREVLAEGVDARTVLDVLADVRSMVDVTVSAWDPNAERWRLLSFADLRKLWEYRPAPRVRQGVLASSTSGS